MNESGTGATERPGPPRNVTSLRARLRNIAHGDAVRANEFERSVVLVVLGQILRSCPVPDTAGAEPGATAPAVAAVKGGTAMRVRLGYSASRFSRDLDVARARGVKDFVPRFSSALRTGWAGFTGELRDSRSVSRPPGVPAEYVMKAYEIKLRYAAAGTAAAPRDLMTVPLEVGHDELHDTVETREVLDPDVPALFAALGLPDPSPLHVVDDHHQIAQKLHAVSAPGSARAHDLIDLQLLERTCHVPVEKVAETCVRLFQFRRAHLWPPNVELGAAWDTLYAAQVGELEVLPDVAEAVLWVNAYIDRLAACETSQTTGASDR